MFWHKSTRSESKPDRGFRSRYGRVYIVPTKFGGIFIIGSLLMLLIGAAYQNNLVNLLGFFMLALMFTSMISTHNNINRIDLQEVEPVFGFDGETFAVAAIVANKDHSEKVNCEFSIRGFKKEAQYDARRPIAPMGESRLLASFTAPERGVYPLPLFILSTTAPFGLFKAWQYQPSEAAAIIYPKRIGDRSWTASGAGSDVSPKRSAGSEEFYEHRAYRHGDNLRRVDWLAFARGRGLLTKQFDEPDQSALLFDFSTPLLERESAEQRLRQISRWIELAVQRNEPFIVRLPGKTLGPDRGVSFAHRAWTELAQFGEGSKQ